MKDNMMFLRAVRQGLVLETKLPDVFIVECISVPVDCKNVTCRKGYL